MILYSVFKQSKLYIFYTLFCQSLFCEMYLPGYLPKFSTTKVSLYMVHCCVLSFQKIVISLNRLLIHQMFVHHFSSHMVHRCKLRTHIYTYVTDQVSADCSCNHSIGTTDKHSSYDHQYYMKLSSYV